MSSRREPFEHAAALGLAALQDWLCTVVTTPGGVASGLARARQCHPGATTVTAVVRGDARASAERRLAVHASGYLARLLDCMRAEYPGLVALVGEPLFDRFATGYLWSCPPRGPSLFELGAGFAGYLARTRPPDGSVPAEQRALLDLPADLARVERARLEAIRAAGLEPRAGGAGERPGSHELLAAPTTIIAVAPCLRVVECAHDVRAFLAAVDGGRAPSVPKPEPCILGIGRVAYRLAMTRLEPWQRDALARCSAAEPCTIGELAQRLASGTDATPGARLADLALWLPVAVERGLAWLIAPGSSPRAARWP